MSGGGGQATGEEGQVPAGEGQVPTGLCNLSDVCVLGCLAFLPSESVLACVGVCKTVGRAAGAEELWRERCFSDWGSVGPQLPDRRTSADSHLAAWVAWKRAFRGYDASMVRRVCLWWTGVEEWVSRHIPEMAESLTPGATESALDAASASLGWELPAELRVLYHFHDGQWLPWDTHLDAALGEEPGRPGPGSLSAAARRKSLALGLFGGYGFYDHMATCKMWSLARGVTAAQLLADPMREACNRAGYAESTERWGVQLDAIQGRGGFLLAANHDLSKRVWVGVDGCVRMDGKDRPLFGVMDAAPAREGEGNLIPWLEEYLGRLRGGWYKVRQLWEDDPVEAGAPASEPSSGSESYLPRGICLFPAATEAGRLEAVTRGVQVQVSAVFVPEWCRSRAEPWWAYSVRMRLLRDHPSCQQGMQSCQLTKRHWEIDGGEGFHREVDGAAVIGLHPLLRLPGTKARDQIRGQEGVGAGDQSEGVGTAQGTGEDDDNDQGEGCGDSDDDGLGPFFEYQSCTSVRMPPGSMGGYFTFQPGSMDTPQGAEFPATVPTFPLVVPSFIY